jgi:hypothetical protein
MILPGSQMTLPFDAASHRDTLRGSSTAYSISGATGDAMPIPGSVIRVNFPHGTIGAPYLPLNSRRVRPPGFGSRVGRT